MIYLDINKALHGSNGKMNLKVNLEIKKGEFVILMGESGAGKTTLLRAIAGIEKVKGYIEVDGNSWQNVPPKNREIGFVFQDYALFENMSVEENLLFVNKNQNLAAKLLEMTELTVLKKRNVQSLSGGQKQRVALCRAIMKKPKILLLDEPFSALDSQMRSKLQQEIKELQKNFNITTIMVSHEPTEAYALADRVLVLEDGKVSKYASVDEVLGSKKDGYSVEVLKLSTVGKKIMASVYFSGELMEVEVDDSVKVSDIISVKLNAIQTLY